MNDYNCLFLTKGGVKTPEGKAISRLNARKHGIFASALTSEDAKELHGINDQLAADIQPVGPVEEMLVEKLALTYLQLQRCARAEAEYYIRTWEEPDMSSPWEYRQLKERRARGERAIPFNTDVFSHTVKLIGLYDMRLTNQFLRLLHEIERLQRLRAGEKVPAPVVADVTVDVAGAVAADAAKETAPLASGAGENATAAREAKLDQDGESA